MKVARCIEATPKPGDEWKVEMLAWMVSLFIVIFLSAVWSKWLLFFFGVAILMRLKLILKTASADLAAQLQEQK